MVTMSFLPSAERLTVVLIKARNLRVVDDTRNASDPYVKVSIIHGGKKIKKRKSGVYRNTVCPTFNEALTFDINKELLKNCIIEFVVVHDSLLGTFIRVNVTGLALCIDLVVFWARFQRDPRPGYRGQLAGRERGRASIL